METLKDNLVKCVEDLQNGKSVPSDSMKKHLTKEQIFELESTLIRVIKAKIGLIG